MPGWRQKAASSGAGARSRSPVPERRCPEQLKAWLTSWAWGCKTASDIVRDAKALVLDHGLRNQDQRVQRLSKTSYSIQHAERTVESILPLESTVQPTAIPNSSVSMVLAP